MGRITARPRRLPLNKGHAPRDRCLVILLYPDGIECCSTTTAPQSFASGKVGQAEFSGCAEVPRMAPMSFLAFGLLLQHYATS